MPRTFGPVRQPTGTVRAGVIVAALVASFACASALVAHESAAHATVVHGTAAHEVSAKPGSASAPAKPGARHGGAGAPSTTRRARSYEQCRSIALQRRLRGAERRHYMVRCQLGYGRPLFRRRGPRHALPPAAGPT